MSICTFVLVDQVAHVFEVLKNDLKSDTAKELFLYYQATPVLVPYLKPSNKVRPILLAFTIMYILM